MPVYLINACTIQTLYMRCLGQDLTMKQITKVQQDGLDPALVLPPKLEELDHNGFEFSYDPEHERGPWCWTHIDELGYAPGHKTLEEAAKNAYWHYVGLYRDIQALTKAGFEVIPFGDPVIYYWRYCNGHRVSALFPTEETAWRDAIRTYPEMLARRLEGDISARRMRNPLDRKTVAHKSQGKTFEKALKGNQATAVRLADMKKCLEAAGYSFSERGWSKPDMVDRLVLEGEDWAIHNAWHHCVTGE